MNESSSDENPGSEMLASEEDVRRDLQSLESFGHYGKSSS